MIVKEIVTTYSSINAPSATLYIDRVDKNLLELTENFTDITDYEVKTYYELRGQKENGSWTTTELFSSEDYGQLRMNKVFPVEGAMNPKKDEMLIERDSLKVSGKSIGDTLQIQLPDGTEKELMISGVINDLGVHPATMHNTIYTYVSPDTLASMNLAENRLDIQTAGNPYDREEILGISNHYMQLLEEHGYQIRKLSVEDTPGISMHLSEYETVLFLLRAFSLIALVFGCLITSSLITSILSKQIREMGILKSIGGRQRQITVSYLAALSSLISVMGICVLPLSKWIAVSIAAPLLRLSNMSLTHTQISPWLYGILACFCLLLPLFIAYPTIRKGTRITIKDALTDTSLSHAKQRFSRLSRMHLKRPVMLILKNVLRKKSRLAMNMTTLVIGGICFVTVFVGMFCAQSTLDQNMNSFGYEYRLIAGEQNTTKLGASLEKTNAVDDYEFWGFSSGKYIDADGSVVNSYPLMAIPDNSTMIKPDLMEGKWLTELQGYQVVVSHSFLNSHRNLALGDSFRMNVGGIDMDLSIAGIMKDFSGSNIYMKKQVYDTVIPAANRQEMAQITLRTQVRRKELANLIHEIEEELLENDVSILQSETKEKAVSILKSHFMPTFQTFLIVILMILIIAAFGLASTTNIQTLERVKEVGIMKSLGASKKQIIQMITRESIFVGLLSFLLSVVLSIPAIIVGLAYFSANTLKGPMNMNWIGLLISYLIWLVLTLLIGKQASKRPALRAARMTIRECLLKD